MYMCVCVYVCMCMCICETYVAGTSTGCSNTLWGLNALWGPSQVPTMFLLYFCFKMILRNSFLIQNKKIWAKILQ